MATRKCGIKANGGMIGFAACDLEWGHGGDIHANQGDGFRVDRKKAKRHSMRQLARREYAAGDGQIDVELALAALVGEQEKK